MSFIILPPNGESPYFGDPVVNSAALPASDDTGAVRLALDTGRFWWFDGASWDELSGVVVSASAPLVYDVGTGDISIPVATAAADGYLSSANWSTFNSKESAITAGTTAQYWRGDKSFQTLEVAALVAVTAGGNAAAGAVGEILSGSQASNTTSNVGASGSYGYATSVSLTAGVWQVQGVAGFNENGAVLTTALECGISASSTGSGISEFDTTLSPFQLSGSSDALIPTPMVYISIASTTTYYLNTKFTYSSGTPRHRGRIQALRIR